MRCVSGACVTREGVARRERRGGGGSVRVARGGGGTRSEGRSVGEGG